MGRPSLKTHANHPSCLAQPFRRFIPLVYGTEPGDVAVDTVRQNVAVAAGQKRACIVYTL